MYTIEQTLEKLLAPIDVSSLVCETDRKGFSGPVARQFTVGAAEGTEAPSQARLVLFFPFRFGRQGPSLSVVVTNSACALIRERLWTIPLTAFATDREILREIDRAASANYERRL